MTAAAHSREPPAGDSCCAINLSAGARLPGAGSDAFLIRNLLAVGQRATPPGQPVDLRTGGRRPGEPSAHQPAGAQEPGAAHNNNNNNKQRRSRTMFTEWQLAALEWRFARNKYLTTSDRIRIAKLLQLDQLQVKTWFQNRRMKWKKQILATGCLKAPTKPKGRPRRDSIPPIDD